MKAAQHHANPLLVPRLSAWRSRFILAMLFLAFMTLLGRALQLQGFSTGFLQDQGKRRYESTLDMPATRGKITDRNGVLLASSVPALAVGALPDDVDASPVELDQLADLLEMPIAELKRKLSGSHFVYLKRQVPQQTADKIKQMKLKGIDLKREYLRVYPQGETVAHLIGFTSIEDVGIDGIELAWQKDLAGMSGSRAVIHDRLGRTVEEVEMIRAPRDGKDLTLSIDNQIQSLAFSSLKDAIDSQKAKAGAIVVLDVRSGEILALANWPSYDPNDHASMKGPQLRNRVLTDTYEPGSTIKPFTIALALENGVVTPTTPINTAPGRLTIGTATISDSHAHGVLTVEEVIQKSSNVGTSKIALKMEPRQMWEMYNSVGLGQTPQIGFPGAVAGRLRPYRKWRPIEQATMSYGYGESVSLIQMARAYSIFARDGELIPLSFFKSGNISNESQTDGLVHGTRIISPSIAAEMRKMLEMAAGPGGTAPRAQVVGYRVAGKTGTAHKLLGGAYAGDKYIGSFVGFAPVSNPRIIVAVMIDEPGNGIYYGGDVAAPVFSAVVGGTLRIMGVEPDSQVKSLIIPNDALPDL